MDSFQHISLNKINDFVKQSAQCGEGNTIENCKNINLANVLDAIHVAVAFLLASPYMYCPESKWPINVGLAPVYCKSLCAFVRQKVMCHFYSPPHI